MKIKNFPWGPLWFAVVIMLWASIPFIALYQEKKKMEAMPVTSAGIVKDFKVIPTSFNESTKSQITTTDVSIVVNGIPQIELYRMLFVKRDGKRIMYVEDAGGSWFKTVK